MDGAASFSSRLERRTGMDTRPSHPRPAVAMGVVSRASSMASLCSIRASLPPFTKLSGEGCIGFWFAIAHGTGQDGDEQSMEAISLPQSTRCISGTLDGQPNRRRSIGIETCSPVVTMGRTGWAPCGPGTVLGPC
jgi:hypothetical protein